MFIGVVFSKDITKCEVQHALNWIELIKSVSEQLELEFPNKN